MYPVSAGSTPFSAMRLSPAMARWPSSIAARFRPEDKRPPGCRVSDRDTLPRLHLFPLAGEDLMRGRATARNLREGLIRVPSKP
jgi:hypothetical protein